MHILSKNMQHVLISNNMRELLKMGNPLYVYTYTHTYTCIYICMCIHTVALRVISGAPPAKSIAIIAASVSCEWEIGRGGRGEGSLSGLQLHNSTIKRRRRCRHKHRHKNTHRHKHRYRHKHRHTCVQSHSHICTHIQHT